MFSVSVKDWRLRKQILPFPCCKKYTLQGTFSIRYSSLWSRYMKRSLVCLCAIYSIYLKIQYNNHCGTFMCNFTVYSLLIYSELFLCFAFEICCFLRDATQYFVVFLSIMVVKSGYLSFYSPPVKSNQSGLSILLWPLSQRGIFTCMFFFFWVGWGVFATICLNSSNSCVWRSQGIFLVS